MKNIPAFGNKTLTADELREIYSRPAAGENTGENAAAQAQQQAAEQMSYDGGTSQGSARPMTYESTIQKTVLLFVVLLATASVGWFIPLLALPAAIVGLVLGLVNSFKREPSPALIMTYAAVQGVFLGGISGILNAQWAGIVSQAVMGTLIVFGVTLLLFRSGKVRTSPRFTKIIMIAMIGYFAFSLVNFGLILTGTVTDPWGMRGATVFGIPLGLLIGAVAVFLAAYSLVMDFEMIQNGVQRRVDDKYSWAGAFGLIVTLVWLYVEILRILAILRGDD